MTSGMLVAYMDDVRIVGPPAIAIAAYTSLIQRAFQDLGVEEVPSKGSVIWHGEGSPNLAGLPADMPGVRSRLSHDKTLGVFVGDARPASVAAVEEALKEKFAHRAAVLDRIGIIPDPQIRFQILRVNVSSRPGFWLRTMKPDITVAAATAFDCRVQAAFSDICNANLSLTQWRTTTLPCSIGGLGITSQAETRHAAHFATWAASWAHIKKMFLTAIPLTANDLATSPLPFAVGLRAAHQRVEHCATMLTNNLNGHPLPPHAPTDPDVPDVQDFTSHFSHAQKRFAFVVHCARWLERFHLAPTACRARLVSQSRWGAMSAFLAVPSHKFKLTPINFIIALQLSLRLPVMPLIGIRTCMCGTQCDSLGDHVINCNRAAHRTPGHNLIQDVVATMAKTAGKSVAHDSNRNRALSRPYSPLWCPDLTLLHGAPDASHIIIDIVTTSVVTQGHVIGAATTPFVAAIGAESKKDATFGQLRPHSLVPFAVEDGGALGPRATRLFKDLQKECANRLRGDAHSAQTWSATGFSNYFRQQLSIANFRGLGHLLTTASSSIRADAHSVWDQYD